MPHQDSAPRERKSRQGGPGVPFLDLFRLDGRTIVISGGGGGLGLVATETILGLGGDVVCFDLRAQPPEGTWASLEAKATDAGRLLIYQGCDVTDADEVAKSFANIVPSLRYPVRGLIACAGLSDTGPSVDYPPKDFLRILNINIMGSYIMAQATAREMRANNVSGSMVLIASMSGWVCNKGADSSAYNTAKSGVHQLGRSLASEWGSNGDMPLIRVNTISPGYIRTAATMEALQHPGMEERWADQNMLYRLCEPDELRGPMMFLLSDASSFVTASDMLVDGGHCAW